MSTNFQRPSGATTSSWPATASSGNALSASSQRVLRNTYALLGLTLAFSAGVAGLSMSLGLPHPGLILTLIGFFGLSFLVNKTAHSGWGVLAVFGLTGFMGYTLGPILSNVLSLPNGAGIVTNALMRVPSKLV